MQLATRGKRVYRFRLRFSSHVLSRPKKSDLIHKIDDGNLRLFATDGDADEGRPVLIELASQPVDSNWFKSSVDVLPAEPMPKRRSHATAPPVSRSRMDDLAGVLSETGIDEAVRLNLAEAFSARVNPLQLRKIVKSPLVGAVRLNRLHRKRSVS